MKLYCIISCNNAVELQYFAIISLNIQRRTRTAAYVRHGDAAKSKSNFPQINADDADKKA